MRHNQHHDQTRAAPIPLPTQHPGDQALPSRHRIKGVIHTLGAATLLLAMTGQAMANAWQCNADDSRCWLNASPSSSSRHEVRIDSRQASTPIRRSLNQSLVWADRTSSGSVAHKARGLQGEIRGAQRHEPLSVLLSHPLVGANPVSITGTERRIRPAGQGSATTFLLAQNSTSGGSQDTPRVTSASSVQDSTAQNLSTRNDAGNVVVDVTRFQGVDSPSEARAPQQNSGVERRQSDAGAGGMVSASAGDPWTEIVRRAINFNPDIVDARSELQVAMEELNIATAAYRPQISADAQTGYSANNGKSDERINLNVSQMLYDFGKVDAQVTSADQRIIERASELDVTREDVIRDTLSALIDVSSSKASIDIAEQQLVEMQDLLELARKRERAGAGDQADIYEAESNVEATRSEILDYKLARSAALGTLESLTGAPIEDVDEGRLPRTPDQACRGTDDVSRNPRLLAARARIEVAKAQLDENRANQFPTLALEPSVAMAPFRGGDTSDRIDANVNLSVNAPLYQGGATQARIRASESGQQGIKARLQAIQLDLKRSLDEARISLDSLNDNRRSLETRLNALDEIKDLYRRQYTALGSRTLSDLSSQYRNFFSARQTLNETRQTMRRNGVACLHAKGELRGAYNLETSDQRQGTNR